MRNQNFIYSPSVTNLGGVMQPMDMSDLSYTSPMIATPDNRTVFVDGGGYGTSRAQYQTRLSAAPNLGGGIADIAATFNMVDLFLGNR
jgi:hypothetical protein